jgi:hypothetical protein
MGIFQVKLLLILTAITNVLLLHRTMAWKSATAPETIGNPALRVKIAALFSILLWVSVIICGRMIAYYA